MQIDPKQIGLETDTWKARAIKAESAYFASELLVKTLREALKGLEQEPITKKPPIGLEPKFTWLEHRLKEIVAAMNRYLEAEKPMPSHWINELEWILPLLRETPPEQIFFGDDMEKLY